MVHEADGKIKLHQAMSTAGTGAAGGALWGGLIGLLFAALIALGRSDAPDKVLDRLRPYGGEVIQTSLDNEEEQRLRSSLGEPVAAG